MPTDTELLKFILDQMQAGSPHMDGTFSYHLPHRVTMKHRARSPREAIEKALSERQAQKPLKFVRTMGRNQEPLPGWANKGPQNG